MSRIAVRLRKPADMEELDHVPPHAPHGAFSFQHASGDGWGGAVPRLPRCVRRSEKNRSVTAARDPIWLYQADGGGNLEVLTGAVGQVPQERRG